MRDLYIQELENLNLSLIEMGGMCEELVNSSIKIMMDNNYILEEKNKIYDNEIDRKEKEIESTCIDLIQCQQPVASDLHFISSVLKIITDMERIGDQASDIIEIISHGNVKNLKYEQKLVKMSSEVSKMVTGSIDSFIKRDMEKANEIIENDELVDILFSEIKKDMILDIINSDNNMEYIIDMLMISKYLERIADHATNISEWTIYASTGKHEKEYV